MAKLRELLANPRIVDLRERSGSDDAMAGLIKFNQYLDRKLYDKNGIVTIHDFEVFSKSDNTYSQNIFNRYILYLISSRDNLLQKINFTDGTHNLFKYNSKLISTFLYGVPDLFYILLQINSIQESDLSPDFLSTTGLYVLTTKGIEALKNIKSFRKAQEGKYGSSTLFVEEFVKKEEVKF